MLEGENTSGNRVRDERQKVPEGATAVPVDLGDLVAEESNKRRNATKLPGLRLHRVVHVAEVLQVGRRVSLAAKSHRWQGGSAGKQPVLKTFVL